MERRQLTREEWLASLRDDLNPINYAGEGMYATEEYAKPDAAMDPWTRSRIGREGDYWPPPDRRRRR